MANQTPPDAVLQILSNSSLMLDSAQPQHACVYLNKITIFGEPNEEKKLQKTTEVTGVMQLFYNGKYP